MEGPLLPMLPFKSKARILPRVKQSKMKLPSFISKSNFSQDMQERLMGKKLKFYID